MAAWSDLPDLESCETLVEEPSEMYLRQVTAAHAQGDQVHDSAFKPPSFRRTSEQRYETPEQRAERYKLSGARSSKQTAKGAYEERQLIRESAGTWGVEVREVDAAGSRIVDDSECPQPPGEVMPTGHAYLDQRIDDNDRLEELRARMADAASRRGRLYPPLES